MTELAGYVFTDAGLPVANAEVDVYYSSDTTHGTSRASTTTNSIGYWAFNALAEEKYDVKLKNGSSIRWVMYLDERSHQELETSNLLIRNPAGTFVYDIVPAAILASRTLNLPLTGATRTLIANDTALADSENILLGTGGDATIDYDGSDLVISPAVVGAGDVVISGGSIELDDDEGVRLGTGKDTEIRWSDGDADNHSLVIAVGDSNQSLHITDLAAVATDWAIAATTHPNVYIHSNTTPATDFLRLGDHDGTTAYIDNVGGTTLAFEIGGTTHMSVAANALTGNVVGTGSSQVSAGDHSHVGSSTPSTQAHSDSAATGSSTEAARVDHKHAMPAAGGPTEASEANMEDEATGTIYAPPDLIKHSPGVAKFWVKYDGASAARNAYYNVGSVTDGGTGDHTVNITTDFSSAHWCATMATRNAGTGSDIRVETMAAGTLRVLSGNGSGAADSTYECIAGFGTQV